MMMAPSSLEAYQSLNKFFLSCIGVWPHQSIREKCFFFAVTIFFVVTQGLLQIGGFIMSSVNPDVFMESVPPVFIDFVCYIKLINVIYHGEKIKILHYVMEDDWKNCRTTEELNILRSFAVKSRKHTLAYAGAVYGSMVPFMLGPLLPMVNGLLPIDALSVSNGTILKPLMFHVEYLVDVDKWYYYLLIHSYIGTLVYITVVVAIDTLFVLQVYHACALFGITGHHLMNLVERRDKLDVDVYPQIHDDQSYRNAVKCISQHNAAIQYSELIESANTMSFFFQLGISMICISFTGFQAVTKMDQPEVSVRYASFLVAQIFPILFASYPSECLTTESVRLLDCVTNSAWYLTSIRTRKLLNLVILRLKIPCRLTAGRFFTLNMEYFSTVIRTSMSYLTLLCSVR